MSYALINTFLRVLSDQLKKLSSSIFFRTSSLEAMLGNTQSQTVKTDLVKALLSIAKDFTARSVNACRSIQAAVLDEDKEKGLAVAEVLAQRVTGMIRWDESNHLVILFHHDMQTVDALYRHVDDVPKKIQDLFTSQGKLKELKDFKQKNTEELETLLIKLIRKPTANLSLDLQKSIGENYVLTPDNLLKMALISMRINTKVPVLIMGETGCGKTSLIQYMARMSGVHFEIFSIHAGISDQQILKRLSEANENAMKDLTEQHWLFLDEINTCDHIGLISSALCHRFCHGINFAPNLVLLAACNPYRLRQEESILTAGLTGKIKTDSLSRLVYRVNPLPETLIDFVWDFGSLSEKDEVAYIRKMVSYVGFNHSDQEMFADVLVGSQCFVRLNEGNDYCVSLRDVDRCRRLVLWLDGYLGKKNTEVDTEKRRMYAIILGLSVCYHSRFEDGNIRQAYRHHIAKILSKLTKDISPDLIKNIIQNEQKDILKRMTYFPEGTALNVALQENVFILLVCILSKIPIFLVGKPGCSKSLAMQLIRSNLRGKDSTDKLFQSMPQLFCVSFQGSESSTSEGIMKVFEKAQKYQEHNDENDVLSVVILDEIGLVEISRFNPLKVLHNLIEPDCGEKLKIAVVGISNWALDAAKMNRAIHLSRPDMNINDLKLTGQSIGESMINQNKDDGFGNILGNQMQAFNHSTLEEAEISLLDGIACGYNDYCSKAQKFPNFHGLRDFYSLTKYIGRHMEDIFGEKDNPEIILIGILRNFGGLPNELQNILDTFKRHIPQIILKPVPVMRLIRENISDKSSRHLMLITTGDVVISVLEKELHEMKMPFEIIFGSRFEEDLSDDYNYRILSRIILCMEQGMVLILKDLEAIYGSLYDMLNQNYTVVGKKKNCRVALGHYSNPMCHVHDDFKCIVLAEEIKLDYFDPPFLNRFEKQKFEFKDLIDTKTLQSVIGELNLELEQFCQISNHSFLPSKVIPSYSLDLIISLVVRTSLTVEADASVDRIKTAALQQLLWLLPPEVILRARESLFAQTKAHLAIERISRFMTLPVHGGLCHFFNQIMTKESIPSIDIDWSTENVANCFVVYTFSSVHSAIKSHFNNKKVQKYKMAFFKSEKQLTITVEQFFASDNNVFIIQCSATADIQNILLSKVIIERTIRQLPEFENACRNDKYICMIVHVNRQKFHLFPINFLSGWKLLFMDSIETPTTPLDHFLEVDKMEIVRERMPLHSYIKESLFWVFTTIRFTSAYNSVQNLEDMLKSLKSCQYAIDVLEKIILIWIENQPMASGSRKWYIDVAKNAHELLKAGSMVGALERRVHDFIKTPLSIYIFQLIKLNILTPVFFEDQNSDERQKVWGKIVLSGDLLDISDIPEPSGPECYTCSSEFLSLRMPYSQVFIDLIDQRKSEFLNIVRHYRIRNGIDEDDEIPKEQFEQTILECANIICYDAVRLENFDYTGRNDDFIHDFCNIHSYRLSAQPDDKRISVFMWALSNFIDIASFRKRDFNILAASLHASVWVYGSIIEAICQMAELSTSFLDMRYEVDLRQEEQNFDSDKENKDFNAEYPPQIKDQTSGVLIKIGDQDRASFVKVVSLSLLPLSTKVKPHDLDKWLSVVGDMLPSARLVYFESKELRALKLCQDIVETFYEQGLTHNEQIYSLAECLKHSNGMIDSQNVCDLLFKILKERMETPTVNLKVLQRLFCSYILRCLSSNPENTEPFQFALSKIVSNEMFDPCLTYFGQVLRYAIMLDLEKYEKVFLDMISDEKSENENEVAIFTECLCRCMEQLHCNHKARVHFLTILTDLLEVNAFGDIFSRINEESETKHETGEITDDDKCTSSKLIFSLLFKAYNKAKTGDFSLQMITSIAYIKTFLKESVKLLKFLKFDCLAIPILSKNINAIICQNDCEGFEKLLSTELLHYFIQNIEQAVGQDNVEKLLRRLDVSLQVLKPIVWNNTPWEKLTMLNPLGKHVQRKIFSDCKAQINEILQGKSKQKTTLSFESPEKTLPFLAILVEEFYMKKMLQKIA